MALVVDSSEGRPLGVITLEDVIESLIGEVNFIFYFLFLQLPLIFLIGNHR
jgi:hypothetical protein